MNRWLWDTLRLLKGKTGKGLGTCYSAAYETQQQRFTISEVAADWHELMIQWRIMQPPIARLYGGDYTFRRLISTATKCPVANRWRVNGGD